MWKTLRSTLRADCGHSTHEDPMRTSAPCSQYGNKIRLTETPCTPSPLGIVTNEMIVRPAVGNAFAFEQYVPASRARRQNVESALGRCDEWRP
jgi:hypothetical protein